MFYLQPALYLNQTQSLLILALVAIVLFGAKRLPDSARSLDAHCASSRAR